jgi:hypothetical protein
MIFFRKIFALSFIVLGLFHCSQKQTETGTGALLLLLNEPITPSVPQVTSEARVTTTNESEGVFLTVVNASSTRTWIMVDLKSAGVQSESNWDLRFKRFVIGTNSGTSGNLSASACDTGKLIFAEVTALTSCKDGSSFEMDRLLNQSGGGSGAGDVSESANPALFNWYEYSNTVLKAKPNVYLIKGSDGSTVFKLQMTDYYSKAGTSGYPSFRWARL